MAMRREGGLFGRIADIDNLHRAYYKASRRKRLSAGYLLFRRDAGRKLVALRQELLDGTCRLDSYRQFTISDPKIRVISAAPFRDRIVHHAIMNVLEPVFERQFVFHTYACRTGKGPHAAARYAFRCARRSPWFVKLDVRKFFDSVDHLELKRQLCRIIKDGRCLGLLFAVIDGYSSGGVGSGLNGERGLPIGNLTSQFFANLYLSPLDHYILEQLHPCGYVRYMDDMVLFADSRAQARLMYEAVVSFCEGQLRLALKPPVVGRCSDGVPFLGWRITDHRILLLARTRRRMRGKFRELERDVEAGRVSEDEAARRAVAMFSCRRV